MFIKVLFIKTFKTDIKLVSSSSSSSSPGDGVYVAMAYHAIHTTIASTVSTLTYYAFCDAGCSG